MFISKPLLHQAIAVVPVLLIFLVYGIGMAWVTSILESQSKRDSEFTLSTEQCSWIASLHYAGKMMGPMLAAVLVDCVGRNCTIILSSLNMLLSWIIIIFTKSVFMLYTSRLIYGIGIGTFEVAYIVYIGENCSPSMRGVFNTFTVTFFFVGQLQAYMLPTFYSYATVAVVDVTIAFVAFLSAYLLREPAQFLVAKGRREKAETNFFWLRGRDADTKRELEEIKKYDSEEKTKFSYKSLFTDARNRKTFTVVLFVQTLVFCTGFPALTSTLTVTLSAAGSAIADRLTISYGIVQLVAALLATFFADRFTRRALLLTGSVTSVLVHAVNGTLYYVHYHITELPYFSTFVWIGIAVYGVADSAILFPVANTIKGELLPQNIKAQCGCITSIICSLTSFVFAKTFLLIAEDYGCETNFFLYSFFSLVLTVYVYYNLPETSGMSLVEIQKSLKKNEEDIRSVKTMQRS